MKRLIIIGILVLAVVIHFLLTDNGNVEIEVPYQYQQENDIEWFERENQNNDQTVSTNAVDNTTNTIIDIQVVDTNELLRIVQSFINFSYDWNYVQEDKSLQNYVTEAFFSNVISFEDDEILGGSEYDVHNEASVTIREMRIFAPVEALGNQFEIIVTFNVLYEVPPHSIFSHDIVAKLDVVNWNGNYYVNNKIILN